MNNLIQEEHKVITIIYIKVHLEGCNNLLKIINFHNSSNVRIDKDHNRQRISSHNRYQVTIILNAIRDEDGLQCAALEGGANITIISKEKTWETIMDLSKMQPTC
jgi:hypothetical protein